MDIVYMIAEILCFTALASGVVYFLVYSSHAIAKSEKIRSENTFTVNIKNDEMPSAVGGIFGHTFANLITNFLERKNDK